MKVVATRKVNYNGVWHNAGDMFICQAEDFTGLKAAGVEEYKEQKLHKIDRAVKETKERNGAGK
tara:strand:- start:157 stop:348 length:192 start_codon:yes stop_codon:yes gene_type:complete